MLLSRAGNPMMQQYTVQLFQLEPDKQISLHCRHHKCSQCRVKAKHQGIGHQKTAACHHHLLRGLDNLQHHLCSGPTRQHPQTPLCSMLPSHGRHSQGSKCTEVQQQQSLHCCLLYCAACMLVARGLGSNERKQHSSCCLK